MIVVILSLICISPSLSFGSDVLDIAAKYNEKKDEVVNTETKKRKILSEIYEIEKETRSLVVQKTDLDEKKVQLDHQLAKISKQIVGIEEELTKITPDLIERISFTEQIRDLPWFYAFMTSQSVGDLDQLYQAAENINRSQSDQLGQFLALHDDLEKEKQQLTRTAMEIVQLKGKIRLQEKRIEKNQKHKSRILKIVEVQLATQKEKLKFLKTYGRAAVKNSEFKNLGLLFGAEFFDKKGEMIHPVEGAITQPFGLIKKLSMDSVELMSKGVFYEGSGPAKVSSVGSGRVRFVGKVRGFGRVVIIDHGGHHYSVYGNLQKVSINKDQVVSEKQVIGSTGHHHALFNTGLYFEIRHFSQPQNPENWLKKSPSQLATL